MSQVQIITDNGVKQTIYSARAIGGSGGSGIKGDGIKNIVKLTEEEYETLESYDEETLYVIV